MFRIETDGGFKPLPADKTFINSVVPLEMAKYFFFDGESAESFSSAKNFRAIGEAIRNILGCSLADTAILDLKTVRKLVDRELGQTEGDKELNVIEKKLFEITEKYEAAVEFKKEFKTDISTYRAQREEIIKELRLLEATKEIQKRRDDKNRELENLKNDIDDIKSEMVRWIGDNEMV